MMSGEALKSVSMSISEVESDPAAFRRMLELQGVAIISEVASAAECLELERVWEQSMLALNNGIAEAARGFTPGMGNGFTPLWGLPHCEFSWRCRTHQKVKRLFELIYQTQELCASMDLPFYLPRASTGAPKVCTVAPHADQNVHVPESGECVIYQSILYVWDSTDPATSSTVVCPRSHVELWPQAMEDARMKEQAARADHFGQLKMMSDHDLRDRLVARYLEGAARAPVPAGGVLVWNSRVLPQGYTPGPRLAQPVVWEPRARRPPQVLLNKTEYTLRGLPTTHWAHLGLLHHVCRRMVGKAGKNGLARKCVSSGVPASVTVKPEDRWLRSFGAKDGLVVDDAELNEAISAAQDEWHQERQLGKAFERLAAMLKPEILDAL